MRVMQPAGAAATAQRPPGTVDLRDHAGEIVWAATRAPSYRNLQPWSFRVAAHQVEVYADLSRSCPVADPVDRQLYLGLGAAIFGIRLALARLGLRPIVGLSHDTAHPDLAAVVVSAGPAGSADEDAGLYAELSRRRSVPAAVLGGPVPVDLRIGITDRIRHEGASAQWLSRTTDRSILTDLTLRTAADLAVGRLPIAGTDAEVPPVTLAICTPSDHRAQWLRAGQALHHSLLCASRVGYAAAFLGDLIEVPLLRDRLRLQLGLPGFPQVLIGLGRLPDPPPPPSTRRPPAEVLRR